MNESTPLMVPMTPFEREINNQLETLGSLTSKLKTQAKHLGTSTDSSRFRKKMEQTRERAMKVFRNVKQMFKDSVTTSDVMMQLRNKYSEDISEFISVTQELDNSCRRFSLQTGNERKSTSNARTGPRYRGTSQVQREIEIQVLATHDVDSMQNRNSQIRRMEADVIELSNVFTDVLDLTKEQAPGIEVIDHYVAGARGKVEDARSELVKADRSHQAQAQRKLYCLLVAIAVLLVLFLGYYNNWF
eukprot:CAMPEP_0184489474 /NCGR_PEP_ID=MMETSP0113_2-20130426/15542_1 /TAXON_ID=91329 /ORGANISM="Norrisiella sphaerica, Strain BC52" /LENGTH=244 /DNA_ID=CAMNT_0026872911 /DNA_START=55 /DNA_END=789 /DNA_ORIENTATION=+